MQATEINSGKLYAEKPQNVSEGYVATDKFNKQVVPIRWDPELGGRPGAAASQTGLAPAVYPGLESDLRVVLMAWFGSGPTPQPGDG